MKVFLAIWEGIPYVLLSCTTQRTNRPNQMSDITLPIIHRNGTSRADLQKCYDAADDALFEFIRAWESMEFNARDYYPQGPESWIMALTARQNINLKIREIRDYITKHREHLYA